MNPQQSLTCSEHNTYDLVTVVSTAAPLQPKSSGPLSQPTEPVSCNLWSLVEPGWAGEGFPCCSFLNLLLTGAWAVMTGAPFKPVSSPPLQPASVSINPSSALSGRRVSFLRQQSSQKPSIWAAHGVGLPLGSLWASFPPCIGPDKP